MQEATYLMLYEIDSLRWIAANFDVEEDIIQDLAPL